MVILNQAHLRQVMKPTCEVVQKALSDRDWKSSQLKLFLGVWAPNRIITLVIMLKPSVLASIY